MSEFRSPQETLLASSFSSSITDDEFQALVDRYKEGNQLNVRDAYGQTPLMLACKYGRKERVRMLLQAGVDINLISTDVLTGKQSALFYACQSEAFDPEIVRMLIDSGAKLELVNWHRDNILGSAIRHTNLELVRLLMSYGVKTLPSKYTLPVIIREQFKKSPDVLSTFYLELFRMGMDLRDHCYKLFTELGTVHKLKLSLVQHGLIKWDDLMKYIKQDQALNVWPQNDNYMFWTPQFIRFPIKKEHETYRVLQYQYVTLLAWAHHYSRKSKVRWLSIDLIRLIKDCFDLAVD